MLKDLPVWPKKLHSERGCAPFSKSVSATWNGIVRHSSSNSQPPQPMSKPNPVDPAQTSSEIIPLGNSSELSLRGLTEEQQQQIKLQHAERMIYLNTKAQELGIEAHALDAHLRNMGAAAAEATKNDVAVTMTRTSTDTLGRTEIIMGNTETAAKGKLTRSQEGQKDLTLVYVVIGAIAVVIIAILMKN